MRELGPQYPPVDADEPEAPLEPEELTVAEELLEPAVDPALLLDEVVPAPDPELPPELDELALEPAAVAPVVLLKEADPEVLPPPVVDACSGAPKHPNDPAPTIARTAIRVKPRRTVAPENPRTVTLDGPAALRVAQERAHAVA